jgi:hypothetical protein
MSKSIYDELFFPAEDIRQVATKAKETQRLSELQGLSSHIKFKAKEGKFSTTLLADYCQSFIDEDWEQLRNRGYHITFYYENDLIAISWEKDYGI